MHKRLILTAASKAFEPSLLGLIGSLNVNWPSHPKVLVYDLGMGGEALERLASANVEIRQIPPFCDHWRQHFTWKIWCCNDAPCDSYLWLDAGVCVLKSMQDAFEMIEKMGYFCQPNGFCLEQITPSPLMEAFGLRSDELRQMLSINGGVFGLKKDSVGRALLSEALALALSESNMRATQPLHRHDQALLSILFYRYFTDIVFADHLMYAGFENPSDIAGQKIWNHRRRLAKSDIEYFAKHICDAEVGKEKIPSSPIVETPPGIVMKIRILVAKLRGRYPEKARSKDTIPNGVRD